MPQGEPNKLREWLVIEDSRKNAVLAPDDANKPKGYIPRDVAEKLLGRDLGGAVWFTREDGDKMRAHPDWREDEPPMTDTHAEMIAAVKRQIDRWEQYLAAFEAIRDDTHFETPIDEARAELEAQRAILLHLERTQPTGTQADLLERARALVERWEHGSEEHRQWLRDMCVPDVAAFAQSEREAAAKRWSARLGEVNERWEQVCKDDREAVAAIARRAAIEECARRARGAGDHVNCQHEAGYMDGRLDAALAIEALASPPAPQETR